MENTREAYRVTLRHPQTGKTVELRHCQSDSAYADFVNRHAGYDVVGVFDDPMPSQDAITLNGRYSCD